MKWFLLLLGVVASLSGSFSALANPLKGVQSLARSSMKVEKTRMRTGSENMANAESAGYVPKDVVIKSKRDKKTKNQTVEVRRIQSMPHKQKRVYQPSHPEADANGYVIMPTVNPLIELMNVETAKHNYERSLEIYKMAADIRHKSISLIQR